MDYNKMPRNSFDHFYLSWIPDKGKLKRPYYLTLANALEADMPETEPDMFKEAEGNGETQQNPFQ